MLIIDHYVTVDQEIRYSDGEIAFHFSETFSFLLFERVYRRQLSLKHETELLSSVCKSSFVGQFHIPCTRLQIHHYFITADKE